jgi:predicted signal transduction protein with EAL and GGDEF domain
LAEFVSASALLKRNWFWAALLLLCAPSDGSTASELLLHADIALVHAKADGG